MRTTTNRNLLLAVASLFLISSCGTDGGPASSGRVLAEDQELTAANEVVIATAESDGAAWVVVHALDPDGELGSHLGHVPLQAGESSNVTVTLERDAFAGETLVAILHSDLGQPGVFEFPGPDLPIVDETGNTISSTFVVSLRPGEFDPSLTVLDQTVDDPNFIVIAEVVASEPSWVDVHAENETGGIGVRFAAMKVPAGVTRNLVVELARPVVDGEGLHADLHVNRGDPDAFDFPDGPDVPAVNAAGEIITTSFTVSVTPTTYEPAITAPNLTLSDISTGVLIEEAVSQGPGLLVIHADDDGAPGVVLGYAGLVHGLNEDVEVALDRPASDGETLYAMLHTDAASDGVLDFPGADAPMLGGDESPVVAAFTVTVPDGTPAMRFTVDNAGTVDYVFVLVEPAGHADLLGEAEGDNAISLPTGWRYAFTNLATGHPFELLAMAELPSGDTVLLSQAVEGSFEADEDVAWSDDGQTLAFTLTPALAAELSGYRCATHRSTMRGEIVVE